MREKKTKQQRSRKLYRIGKKDRNIRFFLNESKKTNCFRSQKNETLTSLSQSRRSCIKIRSRSRLKMMLLRNTDRIRVQPT
jgi:hypothetical protein